MYIDDLIKMIKELDGILTEGEDIFVHNFLNEEFNHLVDKVKSITTEGFNYKEIDEEKVF